MHPILIDIGACCEHHTNDALEHLHKAIGEGDPADIWAPHPSPFIRRLVELFTQRGLMRLEAFRAELEKWAEGERHRPGTRLPRPDGAMERWTPGELELVKLYLEALPPDQWAIDDHMMVVEYAAQKYLPAEDLRTEAEWLSTKSTLMGRVQANLDKITEQQADTVLAALPSTVEQAALQFGMTATQRAVMEFGRARCADHVTSVTESVRHRIKRIVMRHQEAKALGDTSGPALQSDLLDAMGDLNRDWRRIAVTESGENANQGFIAAQQPGAKVRRVEQYKGACPFCRKIDGLVVEVVDPNRPDKDDWTMVWTGKTNVGRSAAPRKRVGGALVEREAHEMWRPAAGVQHPHCRGSWVPEIVTPEGGDEEFGAWLRETLRKK